MLRRGKSQDILMVEDNMKLYNFDDVFRDVQRGHSRLTNLPVFISSDAVRIASQGRVYVEIFLPWKC
jgi:hypothetical protein